MVEKIETRKPAVKSFENLKVGDSIYTHFLLNWRFVCQIPQDVAETWLTQHFKNSFIARDGSTPSNGPMKEWEKGVGIIVGAPTVLPGEEKLNLLHKLDKDDIR